MNTVNLYVSKLKQCGHDYLKTVFSFPGYYGCNLDALYDCLGDLNPTAVLLTFDSLPDDFCLSVIEVLKDSRKIHLIEKKSAAC